MSKVKERILFVSFAFISLYPVTIIFGQQPERMGDSLVVNSDLLSREFPQGDYVKIDPDIHIQSRLKLFHDVQGTDLYAHSQYLLNDSLLLVLMLGQGHYGYYSNIHGVFFDIVENQIIGIKLLSRSWEDAGDILERSTLLHRVNNEIFATIKIWQSFDGPPPEMYQDKETCYRVTREGLLYQFEIDRLIKD